MRTKIVLVCILPLALLNLHRIPWSKLKKNWAFMAVTILLSWLAMRSCFPYNDDFTSSPLKYLAYNFAFFALIYFAMKQINGQYEKVFKHLAFFTIFYALSLYVYNEVLGNHYKGMATGIMQFHNPIGIAITYSLLGFVHIAIIFYSNKKVLQALAILVSLIVTFVLERRAPSFALFLGSGIFFIWYFRNWQKTLWGSFISLVIVGGCFVTYAVNKNWIRPLASFSEKQIVSYTIPTTVQDVKIIIDNSRENEQYINSISVGGDRIKNVSIKNGAGSKSIPWPEEGIQVKQGESLTCVGQAKANRLTVNYGTPSSTPWRFLQIYFKENQEWKAFDVMPPRLLQFDSTGNHRTTIWKNAWKEIEKRPIHGHGDHGDHIYFEMRADKDTQTHNLTLGLWFKGGIIAVIFYFLSMATLSFSSFKKAFPLFVLLWVSFICQSFEGYQMLSMKYTWMTNQIIWYSILAYSIIVNETELKNENQEFPICNS